MLLVDQPVSPNFKAGKGQVWYEWQGAQYFLQIANANCNW